ncbi:MAG: sugar transferase [Bacteroidales bacterium]|nr:sugar transferase [Bacteroidales bacterium]
MNRPLQTIKCILIDYLAAAISWAAFFMYRKHAYSTDYSNLREISIDDSKFLTGMLIIPILWLVLYFVMGSYKSVYRKTRVKELGNTFISSIIGVIIIFLFVIIDDYVNSTSELIVYGGILFVLHFGITSFFRMILTSIMVNKIHTGKIGFNTLIIGGNGNATAIYNDILNQTISSGNKFVGFVNVNKANSYKLASFLPQLGHYLQTPQIIEEKKIEEVIIAIDPSEHAKIKSIISSLRNTNVIIKVIPDMYDIVLGSVKMTAIFQAPLIQIAPEIMPYWQVVLKRIMDITISLVAIVVLSPLFIFTAAMVYFTSKGPIFYFQERIGINGKPFSMLKFRTMYMNAENAGPQLSSDNDPRITAFGRIMRKVRLDEIPQFFTVIKGDMSLVGYRPERQFFIDQIIERAPQYNMLLKIKPGITSWGQVKYGYAENVDEMVERLKYDILYIENMSIAVDIKIMFYTMIIVITGRGK